MKKTTQKNSSTEAASVQKSQMAYEHEINRRAYELWKAAGCQHGDDLRYWLEAEREVNLRNRSADRA
jgi:hypothetical protein